jgi:hypothetical protein
MDDEKILPEPSGPVLPFDQLKDFTQVMDYALGGYHASRKKAQKLEGSRARLWQDAAEAYRAAYLAMFPLKTLPGSDGFQQAKKLLDDANHKADVAKATASA